MIASQELYFNMKVVSEKTGLTDHVIRVWEKRYNAIVPTRTDGNHRMYTYDDIAKLDLLRKLTESGYAIRNIAKLTIDELSDLILKQQADKKVIKHNHFHISESRKEALEYLKQLNGAGFKAIIDYGYEVLEKREFLFSFIHPLLVDIGIAWSNQEIRVSSEHLGSIIIRTKLLSILGQNSSDFDYIFTTLPDEDHDIGALIAAVLSKELGHEALFLGANVPLEDIADALQNNPKCKGVVISIVYIHDHIKFTSALAKLRILLGKEKKIILGTNLDMSKYQSIIEATDSVQCKNFADLEKEFSKT